ncbi:MAG TPA: HAD family hydrolase [Povalibacter sp.]|uniref:HAD family hydrolase n=1 Tax=Povalibacter sp. TaxID=1962978 RepID=UPI002C6831F7|nr:HAD family hydrolase [Povalibacter sp.]HMN44164.1 HAD family hydrolase [Povalibacter sp.]
MKFHAALFDFDGTLTPSLPLWVSAYQLALGSFGIEASDEEVLGSCFFRDYADVAAHYGRFDAAQLEVQVDAGLRTAFLRAELFPLARPVVEHCRDHGLRTALVTSSPRNLVIGVLERLGILELFDFVTCGGDIANYKPHPEPVTRALAALECEPARAMMIGDSHVDILAGKAAGTRTALFLPDDHHRFHDTGRLRATGPDHIFADHGELPALLQLPGISR